VYLRLSLLLLLLNFRLLSQDSTKAFSQELGMNVGSLLQQIRIFTVTPGGLPYDLFYNVYYKDKYGVRVGLGILSVENNTQVEGQNTPKTVKDNKSNMRLGVSYYALHSRWLNLNFFVDGFITNNEQTSSNTSTVQIFPNPVTFRTVFTSERVHGGGVQGGAGLRLNITRHLSFYFETAIVYSSLTHVIEDKITETAKDDQSSKSLTNGKETRIDLPNTFYIMIRF
jgi:hypothetical protein